MFAVPVTNKSPHCREVVPKSYVPSLKGTKLLSNLPVAVITSEVALPRFTSALALRVLLSVTGLANSAEPLKSAVPLNVERPDTAIDAILTSVKLRLDGKVATPTTLILSTVKETAVVSEAAPASADLSRSWKVCVPAPADDKLIEVPLAALAAVVARENVLALCLIM